LRISGKYFVRRAFRAFLILIVLIILNFVLPRAMPGSPITRFTGDPRLTPSFRQKMLEIYGLNKPLWEQFKDYLFNLIHLEFGISYTFYPEPVSSVIKRNLPWSLFLLFLTIAISTSIGVLIGMYAAWKGGGKDLAITTAALASRSLPAFWVGMILILVFSYHFDLFPLSGAITPGKIYLSPFEKIKDIIWHYFLPLVTLVVFYMTSTILLMRSSMLETLGEPYILTAKAKGVSGWKIIAKHAFRNAILPIVTNTGINLGFAVSGAVLTETVFGLPGMGTLLYQAVMNRDYPLLQAGFFITSLCVVIALFIIDVIYGFIDPRIRYE